MESVHRVLAISVAALASQSATATNAREANRERSLAVSWGRALNGVEAKDTPVTRVVNLLKEMQTTIAKEQDEDEAQYHELACWCNNGAYEKGEASEASNAKIAELEASIESLSAKSADLKSKVKELNVQVVADKKALATATDERKQEGEDFHQKEMDAIQALENMKAALTVLGQSAFVQLPWVQDAVDQLLPMSFMQMRREDSDSTENWSDDHDIKVGFGHTIEEYLSKEDMSPSTPAASAPMVGSFAQETAPQAPAAPAAGSAKDSEVVRAALKSAAEFLQARQAAGHQVVTPGTTEIVGIMKQVNDEMQANLKEIQTTERDSAKAFAELRSSKEEEISDGHHMSEQKEDELAITNNELAEAKEDLAQEQATLKETETYLANLKKTCAEADKNFNERKIARQSEIKAVSQTIEILTGDEARDAMAGTYNFAQLSSQRRLGLRARRSKAARVLRRAAVDSGDGQLSMLASAVELDAFVEVKKAIDELIGALKTQQEEEVKKNDWCGTELQETTMTTKKTEAAKADLETKAAELEEGIKASKKGVQDAKVQIAQAQVDLQGATADRVAENLEFQKTISDQTLTVEILKKALDKLASYYDAAFVQTNARQTPPVAQAEYKPSGGATGIMSMIEKLIQDAKALIAEAKKGETQAQQAYEQTVADTNKMVEALQAEVTSRSKAQAQGQKDKLQTDGDIADAAKEIDGLTKYTADLHKECDYLMKNFNARQQARQAEVESLQQADQILSGASSS